MASKTKIKNPKSFTFTRGVVRAVRAAVRAQCGKRIAIEVGCRAHESGVTSTANMLLWEEHADLDTTELLEAPYTVEVSRRHEWLVLLDCYLYDDYGRGGFWGNCYVLVNGITGAVIFASTCHSGLNQTVANHADVLRTERRLRERASKATGLAYDSPVGIFADKLDDTGGAPALELATECREYLKRHGGTW